MLYFGLCSADVKMFFQSVLKASELKKADISQYVAMNGSDHFAKNQKLSVGSVIIGNSFLYPVL